MKILALIFLSFSFVTANATTWFIRSDGGNRTNCSGTVDAPYASGMTTKDCGFNDYRLLAYPGIGGYVTTGQWIVKGGDTIRVEAGQYRLGYNGPNASDHNGLDVAGNPFGSAMPPVPSGTVDQPTRIIGDGETISQLFGGYGAGNVINLAGSSFVEISNLELTDHGQCTRVGAGYSFPVVGCSSSYPLSDYAGVGIYTTNTTHDIKLTNLNIHGFTTDGIRGPLGGLIKIDNVRIGFNGSAGWDLDDGVGTKSTDNAFIQASYLTIEGSGCNEEYPIVHTEFPAWSCFDQSSGGYGDALGTPNTPLNVTCDHCIFRYNTQDGADLLHSFDSSIIITNSESYGNMGQQWKLGAMHLVDFEGNKTVHNCSRMSALINGNDAYHKYLSNFCRAGGDGFGLGIKDGGTYIFRNNSFAGYGATTYDMSCAGGNGTVIFQNNLHIGYKQPVVNGQLPGIFYYGTGCSDASFASRDHNIYYNMRTSPTDGVNTDPHIANEPKWVDESSLDSIDFALTTTSTNAKGQGTNGVDIGYTGFYSTSTTPPVGTTTPPPDIGGTTTLPSSKYTLSITLSCTISGTQITCSPNP